MPKKELQIVSIEKALSAPGLKPLPFFLDTVRAGFPSPADDHIETNLDLNELMVAHPASTFFVRVEGDSMEGAKIFSGDILVVDRSLEAVNGKLVVAIVNGEFTIKKFILQKGCVYLAAENKNYPPLKITKDTDFQVWGIVVWVIHKA